MRTNTNEVPTEVLEMISQGVRVTPVETATKKAIRRNWQNNATCDLDKVALWAEAYEGCSWAAVASADTIWILDDDTDVMKGWLEQNAGFETFTVQTSPGHRQYYLKQTDASRALGAVTQPDTDGRFSIRFNNQYGIFSGIHEKGHAYKVVSAAEIVPAPDSLVDYLRSFVTKEKPAPAHSKAFEFQGADELQPITSEQIDGFLEHFKIEVRGKGQGKWHIPCPWRGQHTKHTPASATSILVINGAVIFKCQHSNCKDKNWAAFRKHYQDTSELPNY